MTTATANQTKENTMTYQVTKIHNHTRKREVWPATLTSVGEFAAEVFDHLDNLDIFLAIGRKLYYSGQVVFNMVAEEWEPIAPPVIDLDDPRESYSPPFHDYTYEMTPKYETINGTLCRMVGPTPLEEEK